MPARFAWLFLPLAAVLPLGRARVAPPQPAPPTFADVKTFVADHCGRCHGDKAQKGGVNLAPYADAKGVLRDRKVWRSVAEQLVSGEMPPEGAKQPTKDQRDRMVGWITTTLDAADAADRAKPDPGRTILRRLSKGEYNRTVRDLVGVDLDIAGAVGMPDDPVGEAFDNLSAALNVTDAQMEKYFAAADLIVEKAYAPPKTGPRPKPHELPATLAKIAPLKPSWVVPRRVAAEAFAAKLLRKAYRRPVEAREIERLMRLYDDTATHPEALKPILKAVLVSPHFLFKVERNRAADAGTAYRVGGHELAVRLSYFLWASAPDDELTTAAARGDFDTPAGVEKQARRMLADSKARALTDDFAAQWLRLPKLADARPTTEFFPTFTPRLRTAMADEATTFFDHLRTTDRSVLDLLDADYTFVNAELAKHYGLPAVTGLELRKVTLTDRTRGGLVGMGAVLAMTSHTNRTSPTLRGKYVLDVILGTPPPPPPPGAGQIDETKKGPAAKTFREQLAQHASQPSCAGCHAKIDPLGFGLENFDAVGRFRKSGPDVDAKGQLAGAPAFDGPAGLKGVLLARKPQFVHNLSGRLLSYALGRELQPCDEPTLTMIAADLERDGHKFSTLVLGVVKSYPFQHRRNLRDDD